MYAAFPRSEYYQRIRLPPQHLPFSGMLRIVRHPRAPLCAGRDPGGSLRFLDTSISERTVLFAPAAVSGHLAIDGGPTIAFQYSQHCRPADKSLTRFNRFTRVTVCSSLCLRLAHLVSS